MPYNSVGIDQTGALRPRQSPDPDLTKHLGDQIFDGETHCACGTEVLQRFERLQRAQQSDTGGEVEMRNGMTGQECNPGESRLEGEKEQGRLTHSALFWSPSLFIFVSRCLSFFPIHLPLRLL